MFKPLKLKIATNRVGRKKTVKKASVKKNRKSIKEIVKIPFKKMKSLLKRFWAWVRCIDLIGLVNITLLSAIIVLFSMLILDILSFNNTPKEVPSASSKPIAVEAIVETPSLPIQKDENNKFVQKPIKVVKTTTCKVTIRQTAKVNKNMYGDVIIDSRNSATILEESSTIKGNLFLQNMRKYTLPCGTRIEGNLFLRDVNMLNFCGDFTVTGNIYVSPKSSFGPLPRTARIGGQVII